MGRIFCSMIFVRKTESRVCVLGLGYIDHHAQRERKITPRERGKGKRSLENS